MHCQTNTERPMPVIALVSSSPLANTIRIRAALGYRRTRDVRLVLPWLGIDITWTTRSAFELRVAAGQAIDFSAVVSPELARRIAAAGRSGSEGFELIELEPYETERLAHAIAGTTPNAANPAIPVIDAYSPRNGVLVPVEIVRNQFINLAPEIEKGPQR